MTQTPARQNRLGTVHSLYTVKLLQFNRRNHTKKRIQLSFNYEDIHFEWG